MIEAHFEYYGHEILRDSKIGMKWLLLKRDETGHHKKRSEEFGLLGSLQ
jgi:hypothetical protein